MSLNDTKQVHIVEYATEEKGFEPSYKYNELKVSEYIDGSVSITKTDSGYEDFIYLYPSQLSKLRNILNKILEEKIK